MYTILSWTSMLVLSCDSIQRNINVTIKYAVTFEGHAPHNEEIVLYLSETSLVLQYLR